ncbi:uncharacterized protein LOC124621766 isoform X1 [Schistocerca americana]|uniref:uncharacterized protein LOC124621766 isoform X1 n=1 Tax=Schistocerca americana TaxID=7009 RepID=UPI001F4F7048|nr:uncharacterized protein LOC124621766 isoform X1 [Schistocerca americana]XP_047120799.1 uncharacterized protein LOC124804632 isoform X1 [Schistocerca piceifrons]
MALSSVAALSNAGNTNKGGFEGVAIKQERPDEAEIRELAAKMVEANKAKMASVRPPGAGQPPPPNMVQTGQPGILNYLTRAPPAPVAPCPDKERDKDKKTPEPDRKPPLDEESVRGKFGWVTLGKCHIPYIFRYGEKYCAVRMVESKLLNKYLTYLHSDIYNCTCIRSYYITDAEARLLNEINVRHCEGQFGRDLFTTKDLVVRLQDAGEFYNFLDVCYNKLLLSSSNPKDKCGFVRINGESVVPYTVRDGFKYVPLFYFEGETDNLKLKAEKLEGWDLAYLKFCCKVQGIRNELFASETCSVISLNDIKSYFPPGTVFEDYWPNKVVDSQLLLASSKAGATATGAGMWTKQPPPPPPPVIPPAAPPAVAATKPDVPITTLPHRAAPPVGLTAAVQAVCNGWTGLVGGQPTYQPTVVPQPAGVVRMTPPVSMPNLQMNTSTTASNRSYTPVRPRMAPQYYPQVSLAMSPTTSHLAAAQQQPPPLVRATVSTPTMGSRRQNGVISGRATAATYTSSANLGLPNMHLMGLADPSQHQMLPPAASPLCSPHYTVAPQPQPQQVRIQPKVSSAPAQVVPTPVSASTAKYPPPPLVPVNGTPGPPRFPTNLYGVATTGADVIDLSSPPQSPRRSAQVGATVSANRTTPQHAPAVTTAAVTPASVRDLSDPNGTARKLIQVPDTNSSGSQSPYKVHRALVENKMVPSINSKPFISSELLMTLSDLVAHFFPTVSLASCRQVLQDVLGLDLYRGNRQQMMILREAGKCQSVNDILPLVHLRDVIQYMPQMKYMFSRMNANPSSEESASKRQRTS